LQHPQHDDPARVQADPDRVVAGQDPRHAEDQADDEPRQERIEHRRRVRQRHERARQQREAAAPREFVGRDARLREEVQYREHRCGQQCARPRAGFALDRRLHRAAHHRFLDQRDRHAGGQAGQEDPREAARGRRESGCDRPQVRPEQERRAQRRGRDADRAPQQRLHDEASPRQAEAEIGALAQIEPAAQPDELAREHQHRNALGDPVERPVTDPADEPVRRIGEAGADQQREHDHPDEGRERAHR
jgi:hypothetical protein